MINALNDVKIGANPLVNGYSESFGGGGIANFAPYKPDEFVKEDDEKKKLSTKAKVGIGAGILAFGGAVAAAIFCKGKTLKPANFAEHIDFIKAKTMEEARAFASKHFGVKKFDFGEDVEMANWVNEGLVNISNKFKGKANMPIELGWAPKGKLVNGSSSYCAYATRDGKIMFNKEYFSDSLIEKVRGHLQLICPESEKAGCFQNIIRHGEDWQIKKKLFKYHDKLLRNPKEFTRFDAASVDFLVDDYLAAVKFAENNPTHFLKVALEDNAIKAVFDKHGIDLSIDSFNKLSKEKQEEFMNKFFKVAYHNDVMFSNHATVRSNSNFDVLYHEMGHLLHHMNHSLKDGMWGVLSKKSFEGFKSSLEKQATAGKVSWYAQTNPNEFVAECFNALCAGRELPQEVMDLYRYYKGPVIS